MTTRPNDTATSRRHYRSAEFIGEAVLLAFAAFVFLYMLWDSQNWARGAWLLPRVTIAFGLPFLAWRVVTLLKPAAQSAPQGQIMDTGFLGSDDSQAVVLGRWVRVIGTTAALLIGIWVLGYHVTIPLYTFVYLVIWGHMKWYYALIPGAFLELVMFGYTKILYAEWNRPLILDVLDVIRGTS